MITIRCHFLYSVVLPFIIFLLFLLNGCKKDKAQLSAGGVINIYTAGYFADSLSETSVYWKNGILINMLLTPAGFVGTRATCIAVIGSNVYVGGNAFDSLGYSTALYWKNSKPVLLANGSRGSFVSAVAASGADIYFTGYTTKTNEQISTPTYWKNGSPIYLPVNDLTPSVTRNIAIFGQDVYVTEVGSIYWKNGNLVSTNIIGSIEALAITGSDIYYVGTSGTPTSVATYWKNGNPVILDEPQGAETRPSDAYAIAVSGTNIYILGTGFVGSTNNFTNRYWINGNRVELQNKNFALQATGIAAVDTDVYISGSRSDGLTNNYIGCYWKNGEPIDFTNDKYNSRPSCIFVTKN